MQVQGFFGAYGYDVLLNDLRKLLNDFPFLETETIGRSVMGKRIPAIRMGKGAVNLHYNGAMHANEWITAPLLMRFLTEYAQAVRSGDLWRGNDMRERFKQTSLWIVPMINPDGVELVLHGVSPDHPFYRELLEWNDGSSDFSGWKANIRGVDLNDQFPAHWEEERCRRCVSGPGPRDFTGESPLSEPEAGALAELTRRCDFSMVMALHTQGREIYWNYRGLEPQGAELGAQRLAAASGYEAVKLTDSDAGYKDWFIQEFGRPGFTVEIGLGTNPLPAEQFPQLYEEAADLMIAGLKIAHTGYK